MRSSLVLSLVIEQGADMRSSLVLSLDLDRSLVLDFWLRL